ncbi:hypothetical protein SDC9_10199 [bioreactor metagenome]|jgi:hypothetical protein|uniref:Uncharacterized protein n=2 Tax=root TaxID=1 RepID=A0A652ZRZ0_9SPIR|nr:hypothetical protein [Spirochaetales bacterium]VBB38550.1 conserved hypothetical protein [uncultured Spirochaetota bacterium]HOI21786.1 hypothetical protein [Spirochaetales bacterium]
MKRREFLVHLISELSSFLLQGQPRKMVISLHQEADGIHLAVIDDRARSEVEVKAIERALNASRRPELAGYYGQMAGHDLLGSARLNLVGWQIKHADVLKNPGGGVMLNLWIGGEDFEYTKFSIDPEDEKEKEK